MNKYKGGVKRDLNFIFFGDFYFSNFIDFLKIRNL